MPITTRTDVFDFQVLNYLKLSSNCSVIEPCPCGSWYCEVCQVCHPEFFKQIYVLNLFQNQLTFLQLHLGIGMCDMHTINAQILPQLYICIFLSSKIKKKKKLEKITSNATISPSISFLTLSCLPYFHCLVLSELIKVPLVSISSSLIAQKQLLLFSAESGQLQNNSRVIL